MTLGRVGMCLALIVSLMFHGASAFAVESTEPTPVQLPEHLTKEEARSLMARLSDDQVRALLLQQLDKVALSETKRAPQTLDIRARANVWIGQIEATWQRMMRAREQSLPRLPGNIWNQVTEQGTYGSVRTVLELALALFVGWVLERFFQRLSSGVLRQGDRNPETFLTRAMIVAGRLLLGLMALALFGFGTTIAGHLLFGEERVHVQQLLSVLMWGILLYRVWALFFRGVLAPKLPMWRLIALPDEVARGLYTRALIIVALLIINNALENLLKTFSDDVGANLTITTFAGVVIVMVLLGMVLQARRPVAAMIRGDARDVDSQTDTLRQRLADMWHLLAVVYLILVWILAVEHKLSTGREETAALASLCLPLIAWLADIGLRLLCAQLLGEQTRSQTPTAAAPGSRESSEEDTPTGTSEPETGGSVYEALALRYLRILLAVLVVGVFMGLWHLDPSTWIADFLGERVAAALFDISVTVFLAYIAWGVAKAAIESHAGPEPTDSGPAHGGGDGGGMGGTRVETLLPLVRKFLWVTLVTIVVMVSLSSLGVNIGPLLAGAGMVGIAIGFGAQTLVRDIVSGFFFLLDDAFRIGEYVEIDADTRGTVEKISVRSFQLRHHKGPVHTVPFGEIRSLTNYSRDWAIMKFELRLPFETNIEKVRKIIKGIGQEMQDDPDIGPQLLEPLKSQGVNRMDDSALIIRCKFTAIPGEQFVIRREAFTRIQRAFEEEGIHFAPRRVLVEATTPAAAVAGAAAAIDQETKPQSSSDDRG